MRTGMAEGSNCSKGSFCQTMFAVITGILFNGLISAFTANTLSSLSKSIINQSTYPLYSYLAVSMSCCHGCLL